MKTPAQAQKTVRAPAESSEAGVTRTAADVREEFRKHGISISRWADERGFDRCLVRDVLLGRAKGNYGKAHDIAVALGLKANPGKPPKFLKEARP